MQSILIVYCTVWHVFHLNIQFAHCAVNTEYNYYDEDEFCVQEKMHEQTFSENNSEKQPPLVKSPEAIEWQMWGKSGLWWADHSETSQVLSLHVTTHTNTLSSTNATILSDSCIGYNLCI